MSSSLSESCSSTESPTELVSSSPEGTAVAAPVAHRIPTPKKLLLPKALVRRPQTEDYTSAPRVRTHYSCPNLDRKYPPDRKLLPGGPVVKKAGKPGPVQSFLIPVVVPQTEVAPSSAVPKPAPPPKAAARLDARAGVLVRPSSASARAIPPTVGEKGEGKGKK